MRRGLETLRVLWRWRAFLLRRSGLQRRREPAFTWQALHSAAARRNSALRRGARSLADAGGRLGSGVAAAAGGALSGCVAAVRFGVPFVLGVTAGLLFLAAGLLHRLADGALRLATSLRRAAASLVRRMSGSARAAARATLQMTRETLWILAVDEEELLPPAELFEAEEAGERN